MRIVIIGATGFLGAAVARDLLARNAEVAVLTRRDLAGSRLASMADSITAIKVDFLQPESYRTQLIDFALTAWWGVGGAFRNDIGQLDNLPATGALVEIAFEAGATVVIGTGSQAEYGPCDGPTCEATAAWPTTLYGVAKLAAWQALLQMAAEREMGVVYAH